MVRTALARGLTFGIAALLAAPLICAQTARAQDASPVRIRGTIEPVDGTICVVKARDGAELKVTLAENPQIAGIIKASLADIKQKSFVGSNARHRRGALPMGPAAAEHDGQCQCRAGRERRRWTHADAQIQGRRKEDHGPAGAPIVTYVPGDKSDIKAGARVFIVAVKQADGTL